MLGPTLIYEDNQGAISMATNPAFLKRTKDVQIRYHFVREAVEQGTITLEYCRTDEMLADSFTKALARDQFKSLEPDLHNANGKIVNSKNYVSLMCINYCTYLLNC